MSEFITTGDYDAIRFAIDTKLNESLLPDSTINQQIFLPAAKDEVIARVGAIANLSAPNLILARRAVILLTAAKLVPSTIQITSLSIQTRDVSYSKPAWNIDEKVNRLLGEYEELIDAIEGEDATADQKITRFVSVAGSRG